MSRIRPPCIRWSNRRGAYLVGPLARYNLNFDRSAPAVQAAARRRRTRAGLPEPIQEHRRARVEIVYACEEALRIVAEYEPPALPAVTLTPRERDRLRLHGSAARHSAATATSSKPMARSAERAIVPPTSQNQPCIESDLAAVAGGMLDRPDDEIRHRCEQAIRNYDPCISCSTHFLKLSIRRS